jgi:fused signal recognition particle receptor
MESNFPIILVLVVAAALVLWLVLRRRSIKLPPPEREGEGERDEAEQLEADRGVQTVAREQAARTSQPAAAPTEAHADDSEAAAAPGPQPSAADEAAAQRALPDQAAAAPRVESAPERDIDVLKKGLAHTRGGFIARLAKLFGARPTVDEELIEQIEEVLITADIGMKTSERMLVRLREQMLDGTLKEADQVWRTLREMATEALRVPPRPLDFKHKPSLILIVGVNGAGKTTTIGKLAARYTASGRRVLLAAGDTYRAAAVLQLEVWGRRVNCPVIKGKEGADPSGVIFDAVKRAQEEAYDLVIADTAGRLHTKAPLMEELKKVDRTIQKALGGRGADEILLVLDATTGQNAVQQMHMFREALEVSGVVLTKLDGTAKGGMVLGIVDEHKVPIRFVGLGERVEDLREFDATSFVEALFSKPDGETLAA